MRFSLNTVPIPVSLTMLRKMAHFNPLIVNYHVVSDKRLPYIENLYNYRDIKTFTEDVAFLCSKYYPIGLHDLLNHLQYNTKLPENSFMLTFDDGFREVYDIVLPILLKRKLTATFFLTTGFLDNKELGYMNKKSLIIDQLYKSPGTFDIEKVTGFLLENGIKGISCEKSILGVQYKDRYLLEEIARMLHLDFLSIRQEYRPYLTTQQVNELINGGMTIGSHSIDHPRFSELSHEEQVFQSVSSTKFIQEHFNIAYKVFAFPYTDISISVKFFSETADFFDATFGTQGLIRDCIPNNLQRVNVEKFRFSANRTLKSQYSRSILNNLRGKTGIVRNNA